MKMSSRSTLHPNKSAGVGQDVTLLSQAGRKSVPADRPQGSAAPIPHPPAPVCSPHDASNTLPAAGLLCSVFTPQLLLTPQQHVAVTSHSSTQAQTHNESVTTNNGRIWNNRHVLALLVSTEFSTLTTASRCTDGT